MQIIKDKGEYLKIFNTANKYCSEKKVSPEKPFKGSFNVRLTPNIHKLAFLKAREKGVSLNKYIEIVVKKSLSEKVNKL